MARPNRSSVSQGIPTAAIVVGVCVLLYLARAVLIPLAFACVLTLVCEPAVTLLQKARLGRAASVCIVIFISITLAGSIGWVIFNQVVGVVNELPQYRENIHNKIEAMRSSGKSPLGRAAESVKEIGKELVNSPVPTPAPASGVRESRRTPAAAAAPSPTRPMPVQLVEPPANEFETVRDFVAPFVAPLGVFGVVIIFSVFLLIEQNDLRDRIFRLAGVSRLNVMTQALSDATQRVSRYLLLQLLVNIAFGLLIGLGLYLIHVPYAALWGTVAAILRVVPYVGAPISGLLPLVLSLAVFDRWLPPVLVFLLFATLELLTANVLEPTLYGAHTGISSLALLLTAVFWTVLWGAPGLILSTPLTVCLVVLGRYIPQLAFLHILLGDDPVLTPDAQLYQRLLAMDDQEARAVADRCLREGSLLRLYDSVIVPALSMAEHDRHKGALDQDREEFLFLSVREMLAEFSERTWKEAADLEANGNAESGERSGIPSGRIFCVPASDEADEITAAMLAQLLEQAGCAAISFTLEHTLQQLDVVGPAEDDILFVSALPPFAFARAKAMCQQLEARFPRTKLFVGVWGFAGERERALQRFQPAHPDRLIASLTDALAAIIEPAGTPEAETASLRARESTEAQSDDSSDRIAPVKPASESAEKSREEDTRLRFG